MDHFERELARMMRDSQEHTPFGPEHEMRLRTEVQARHRARTVQKAVGSMLAVAGLGLGFFLLPHDSSETRPQAPLPRPAVSPTSPYATSAPTPDAAPSTLTTEPPTGTAGGSAASSTAPGPTGSSLTPSHPTGTEAGTAPPSSTGTAGAPATTQGTPTTTPPTTEPSSNVSSAESG
ncbi:cellulase [Streptomyces sp. AK04-3B]|uniref:cellulase n=1 Tax=Streptomyces sp. AK04-3B TaxID=3028650 RepID=UPI0029B739D0|nr:cellulase [Streptomyces sp. AK04-3B]MDX3803956.1 cellulase [Streptomyces sp. AK04-3B]